jgi:hypothetical protein
VSVEAAFREDGRDGLGFCFVEMFVSEVALRKDILERCEIDSKISEGGAVTGEGAGCNEDHLLFGFFNKSCELDFGIGFEWCFPMP